MMHLTEYRANAAHLKHQPLDHFISGSHFFGHKFIGLFRQVHQNGAGFDHCVWFPIGSILIDDCRYLGIGIDGTEFRRKLVVLPDVDGMNGVFQTAFLQHDGSLFTVRCFPTVQINHQLIPFVA